MAFGVGVTTLALLACGGADNNGNQTIGSNSLQFISGDTSARVDVGSSKSVTAQYNQAVAQLQVGSLPVGLSITSRISGSIVQMTATVQPEFSFASGPEVSFPVQLTLTDTNGGKSTLGITITAVDLQPVALAVLSDLRFTDNAGLTPFIMLNSEGGIPAFPFAANQITNPTYSPTYSCDYICYDPYNSHWSIAITAMDLAGRTLTYSMQLTPKTLPHKMKHQKSLRLLY